MNGSDAITEEQLSQLVSLLKGVKESEVVMSDLMETTYKLFGSFEGEVFNPYNNLSGVVFQYLVSEGFDKEELSWWLYEEIEKAYYYQDSKYDCSCPENFAKLSLGLIGVVDLPLMNKECTDE